MSKLTAGFCCVANPGCKAPVAWGGAFGITDGTQKTTGVCYQCGENVCSNCSKVTDGVRRCLTCIADNEHHDRRMAASLSTSDTSAEN